MLPPSLGPPSFETSQQQQTIDAQIILLKRQRNTLSPAGSVPPEIVSKILLLSTTNPNGLLGSQQRTKDHIKTLCHISHSWRSIALGCPSLWAAVDISNLTKGGKLKFLFNHARPLPISLYVCLPNTPPSDIDDAQVATPGNLRALHTLTRLVAETEVSKLTFVGALQWLTQLFPVFPHGPTLRSIRITVDSAPQTRETEEPTLSRHILFEGTFQELHNLELAGCLIPLTSPVLLHSPRITHLNLTIPRDHNVLELVAVLQSASQLQRLVIRFRYPLRGPTTDDTVIPAVHLPHLYQLCLLGEHASLVRLLSQLRLSSPVVMFQLSCKIGSGDRFQDFGEQLVAAIGLARKDGVDPFHVQGGAPFFSPNTLTVGAPPPKIIDARLRVYYLAIEHKPSGYDIPNLCRVVTSVGIQFPIQHSIPGAFVDCSQWAPLAVTPILQTDGEYQPVNNWSAVELEQVVANTGADYPETFWRRLSTYPKLTRMSIAAKDAENLLLYLFSKLVNSSSEYDEDYTSDDGNVYGGASLDVVDTSRDTFPFSALQHIEVQCDTAPSTLNRTPGDINIDLLLEQFVGALQQRRELALHRYNEDTKALQSLTILGCKSTPKDSLVTALSNLVHRFVWKLGEEVTTAGSVPLASEASLGRIQETCYDSDEEDVS